MKVATTLLLLCAVAGCASSANYWYKTGATERDFEMAMARCRMGAATLPDPRARPRAPGVEMGARDLESAAVVGQYMNDCLTADGWYRGPAPRR